MSTKPSLSITRRLNASSAKVYDAWTKPEVLMRWFGPDDTKVVRAETDVRVGGRFNIVFRGDDGEIHDVSGIYREVVPGRRLVFTWTWISTPERESMVTVALAPDGDGTVLILSHEAFINETVRDNHQSGWSQGLDKLEALFA